MKRRWALLILTVFLCGCQSENAELNRAVAFRETLLNNCCSFTAEITADYGDKLYTFSVGCTADENGEVSFIVIAPESISGIAGTLKGDSGFLTFDEQILAFPLLADGEVSPVSAPWLLIKTLRNGYISSAGKDGNDVLVVLNDSYEEDALQVDVWLDEKDVPICADIMWQGRRVLSMRIKDFAFV